MKVILLADVKSLGKKGELVNVSDGYAKNFILPKKLGVEANATNMNNMKLQNEKKEREAAKELADAKEMAEALKEITLELKVKAGVDGKVFGSVSGKEISNAMKMQKNITIDKKKIMLDDAIKSCGMHIVKIKLHKDVIGEFKVHVSEK